MIYEGGQSREGAERRLTSTHSDACLYPLSLTTPLYSNLVYSFLFSPSALSDGSHLFITVVFPVPVPVPVPDPVTVVDDDDGSEVEVEVEGSEGDAGDVGGRRRASAAANAAALATFGSTPAGALGGCGL